MKSLTILLLFSFLNVYCSLDRRLGIFGKSTDVVNPKNAGCYRYAEVAQAYYTKPGLLI